ncbi:MAG: hypothetical protein IJV56_06525 [Neisseriaceae bacterium]|nr:hypothetical protein [Neisseriaceae bacterium]
MTVIFSGCLKHYYNAYGVDFALSGKIGLPRVLRTLAMTHRAKFRLPENALSVLRNLEIATTSLCKVSQ